MICITPSESTFNTAMSFISRSTFIRNHSNNFFVFDFCLKEHPATICTCCEDCLLGMPLSSTFFNQTASRTCLNTCTTRYTFRIKEVIRDAGFTLDSNPLDSIDNAKSHELHCKPYASGTCIFWIKIKIWICLIHI